MDSVLILTPFYFLAIIGILLVFLLLVVIVKEINRVLSSPFYYPYFVHSIDISGRRDPQVEELIDEYLIKYKMSEIEEHRWVIEKWKYDSLQIIAKSRLRNYREKQYYSVLDDAHAYLFILYRNQTRYKNFNYQRIAYQVKNRIGTYEFDYDYLANRNASLAKIGYETSLNKYHSKEQRKMMTPQLRRQIIERDNYTCQICGKKMFDEVGLEVDHILPIAKGGKTVPSNLQVLCSKCNRSKHDRITAFR